MNYEIKDILGFPGYRIDTNGCVWSCRSVRSLGRGKGTECCISNKWRKIKLCTRGLKGYLGINLRLNAKPVNVYISRLVANAFLPNPNKLPQVAHRNGIKTDNRVENLKWCTQKENECDKIQHGTKLYGEKHPNNKLSDVQKNEIKELYNAGFKMVELSKKYGVTHQTIGRVINNKYFTLNEILNLTK